MAKQLHSPKSVDSVYSKRWSRERCVNVRPIIRFYRGLRRVRAHAREGALGAQTHPDRVERTVYRALPFGLLYVTADRRAGIG